MSYRCIPCGANVPAGQARLLHIIHRRVNGHLQIAQEVPVCQVCQRALQTVSLAALLQEIRSKRRAEEQRRAQEERLRQLREGRSQSLSVLTPQPLSSLKPKRM